MSSIGGYSFVTIKGTVVRLGKTDEEITRRGVSGLGLRGLGERGPVFNMAVIVDTASIADANSLIANLKALQHTLVTVVEDTGIQTTDVAVRTFTPTHVKKIGTAVGGVSGDPQYLVYGNFDMQCTT